MSSTVQKIKILTNPCGYNKIISKKSLVGKITGSRLHLYEDTEVRTSGHPLIPTCHESSDISSSSFFHCVLSPLTECDGSIWPSTETSETMREEKLFLNKFDCFINYFVIVLKK